MACKIKIIDTAQIFNIHILGFELIDQLLQTGCKCKSLCPRLQHVLGQLCIRVLFCPVHQQQQNGMQVVRLRDTIRHTVLGHAVGQHLFVDIADGLDARQKHGLGTALFKQDGFQRTGRTPVRHQYRPA